MSDELDPKTLRLTRDEMIQVLTEMVAKQLSMSQPDILRAIAHAQLLKIADWIDSLEHTEDEDCKPCATDWLVRALREAASDEPTG